MMHPLERWRLAKGLTYEDFAKRFGVGVATAHRWCSGANPPKASATPRLMRATGLTLDELRQRQRPDAEAA